MKSVCSLPVAHALVEAAGSSVCGLSDVLVGGEVGKERRREEKASMLSSWTCVVKHLDWVCVFLIFRWWISSIMQEKHLDKFIMTVSSMSFDYLAFEYRPKND